MKPVAIFYHTCLTFNREHGLTILREQIGDMAKSGLLDEAKQFFIGLNGNMQDEVEIRNMVKMVSLKADPIFVHHHPDDWPSGEVPTLRVMRDWLTAHEDYNVCYLHMKGLTYHPGIPGWDFYRDWRHRMQTVVVLRWLECVAHLDAGAESVGQWWNVAPNGQYWAGNFWWATGKFLSTLPPIVTEGQIQGGRMEAEVWIGRGPRLPKIVSL